MVVRKRFLAQPPEVLILSQERAEAYQPSGREVCISIRDPRREATPLSPQFLAVLRLTFTDTAKPSPFHWDLLFNENHAREIVRFAREWSDVDRMVVHAWPVRVDHRV